MRSGTNDLLDPATEGEIAGVLDAMRKQRHVNREIVATERPLLRIQLAYLCSTEMRVTFADFCRRYGVDPVKAVAATRAARRA